ncbi:MAG: hypothetical protein JO114_19640 [Planctomycetaceae bacterium]|nr:hypothetical protein [Planctomycetaceae bacterium]MBV8310837.1 hypothetical protein [Planctomycetaceae bacterium]
MSNSDLITSGITTKEIVLSAIREATWGKGFLLSRPGTLLAGGLLRLENSEDR